MQSNVNGIKGRGKANALNELGEYGIYKQPHRIKNPYRVTVYGEHVGVFRTLEEAICARDKRMESYDKR